MYTNAKYNRFGLIEVEKDGLNITVPLDPANTDYQNIMTLVDEGKLVIQPADGVE